MERECLGFQQAFGAVGCAFGTRTAVVVAPLAEVTIPPGAWLVETPAHVRVRATPDAGSTFIPVQGQSTVGRVFSDGFNVQFRGDATGGTAHRSQVLPLA